jgi:hypothetical protein
LEGKISEKRMGNEKNFYHFWLFPAEWVGGELTTLRFVLNMRPLLGARHGDT